MGRSCQTRLVLLAFYLVLLVHVIATYPGIEVQDVPRIEAQKPIDPEVYMKATELITSKGYPCENYYVTTDDGYILNILRIPHGRQNRLANAIRPVVVLQHGLVASCTNFITNPTNQSLAFILADAGADVWLGNSRGNIYSTNHTHLSPKQDEFWDFSWDEMAKYDLPAMIYFILAKTGVDQVYYIGHSQGTTIGFAEFGENQELASHIKHFIAMAPVAQVWHAESPIKLLAPFAKDIGVFLTLFGHGKLNIEPTIMQFLAGNLCNTWGNLLCENVLFLFGGFDFQSLNKSRIPVYVAHTPAGTSVRDILHWGQAINSRNFQRFDYGSAKENMKHYGQPTPPLYDPKKVKVPVAVLRGDRDWLADPTDIAWLLPQIHVTHDVRIPHYEHLDFIWAFDAAPLIYNTILDIVFSDS
ncbi:gastric triacylglycerol lipase-like isoform X2 [Physella acuta]|nr:gastric triacylglycerol lipase-like isoform X2 [Physella acuta]XP_059172876.1 gastric triacylglycerol lipase-like isoform X2 [Physella acuta]XP_059172963.1 gastric triacylglycerol lipase-like isoform X2 [Physella acuta]